MSLRTSARRLIPLAVLVGFCAIAAPRAAVALTVADIIKMVEYEIPDEQIVKKIEKERSVFKLSAQEIIELKKKGVSDKVIRFMLETPQRFGKGTGKGPARIDKAPDKKPEKVLTEAEKRAQEARLREEAVRLAEEARKREEAQRQAFARGILKKGQDLADSGQFVQAINTFNSFIAQGNYGPDTDEAYVAKYGIANALARAGLHQAAANSLLEVVRKGPDKLFFQMAFRQLRELRRKINYRPPELEDLTRFTVVNTPQDFQDEFHYFVGEFLHDFGLSAQAEPYLEKVSPAGDDYPRAQYLIGLIAFEDEKSDLKTRVTRASQAFQQAILSAEKKDEGRPVVDLAYLSLARIAYEIEQFDAAIFYYKKISPRSPKLANAFYESAWSFFLKGDYSRALGTFQALHSPYFAHHFYPELWVLEATIYVNMCRSDYAEDAVKMFEERVLVLGPPLRDFLARLKRPEDYWQATLAVIRGDKSYQLPRTLLSPVMENIEFYNLHQTIRQIEKEEHVIKANLTGLGVFGQDLLTKLAQLKAERIAEAGVIIQRSLRQVQKDIETYQDKLTELRVDLAELVMQKLDKELAGKPIEETTGAQGGGSVIVGSDSMQWPFEGEFWKDEIGAYRAFVRSYCGARK